MPLLRIICLLPVPLLAIALAVLAVHPRHAGAQGRAVSPAMHWCMAQGGDDPSGVIGKQCALYSECLGALNLQSDVDRAPFTGLSTEQLNWVRRCHQVLDDAARANPRIQGSAATAGWLEHHVYPGTEAKPTSRR